MRDLLDDTRLTAADGAALAMLAQRIAEGADIVVGSPVSPAGLDVARELAGRHGYTVTSAGSIPVASRGARG